MIFSQADIINKVYCLGQYSFLGEVTPKAGKQQFLSNKNDYVHL